MTPSMLPLPPLELAMRVGDVREARQMDHYEAIGEVLKLAITRSLPDDWDWTGHRGLDFGCGAGRVLRHFAAEATAAEFWGCDIDGRSIAWMREHLCPPFRAFVVEETPGLPQTDGYYDVAWAMSVFTHLTEHWAGWLLELHRVLKPGGYLIATFMGASMSEELLGEPCDENRLGMNVVGAGRPWNQGGPWVFHSEWWLRAHWGRAFELVEVHANNDHPGQQGLVVLRKKPVHMTVAELERLEGGEPREVAALHHNIAQLHAEDLRVRQLNAKLEARRIRRWIGRTRALARRNKSARQIVEVAQAIRQRTRTR